MDINGDGMGHGPGVPAQSTTDARSGGLHPLALVLGIVGLLFFIVVVAASSYQREKMQHLARKMLRKKRPSFSESNKQRTSTCAG